MIMRGIAKQILKLREAAGKSREEMASVMDISLPAYWDLESYDDEVKECISLTQLVKMGRAFKVSPRDVFSGHTNESVVGELSFGELSERIKTFIGEHAITIPEFEEKVGWAIEEALKKPDQFEEVNLQCLIDICDELQLEWLSIVPK